MPVKRVMPLFEYHMAKKNEAIGLSIFACEPIDGV